MKNDNMKITTYERIGRETAGKISSLDGDYIPYSQVGTIVNETTVLCAECATETELKEGPLIQENSEWDYPGAICEECDKPLDTYLLVYRENHPKVWHQLVWNEQLGNLSEIYTDDEKLAKQAEIEAYELGWSEGETMSNVVTDAEAEQDPRKTEYQTDSAHYANNIAPELRALSGYIDDGGHGTYQTVFRDVSVWTFNEGVSPAFHAGYYDRIMNSNEKWDSQEKYDEVIE